ncbi:MAG: hypothetical protein EHM70_16705 [Chloroflexota bacterium]|nr:MAG: hypothetical protein EHM70_16705 [Chloroflexota bacterium]
MDVGRGVRARVGVVVRVGVGVKVDDGCGEGVSGVGVEVRVGVTVRLGAGVNVYGRGEETTSASADVALVVGVTGWQPVAINTKIKATEMIARDIIDFTNFNLTFLLPQMARFGY